MEHLNPQEPPSRQSSDRKNARLPFCVYDLYLDLPHPSATANGERTQIIDPPVTVCPILAQEMYNPENIARLSKFAFPEHDELSEAAPTPKDARNRRLTLTSGGRTFQANLTKYDVYQLDFIVHHHTFSILLTDGRTRVHGHVRRYLPRHADSLARTDVGRRRPRAMVILTRAIGGERFYSSLLKTVEAISVESSVNKKGCFATKKSPTRAFLHSIFNKHATLTTQYAELRRHGLSLNFVQTLQSDGSAMGGAAACENAKRTMEENENLFKISIEKIEFGGASKRRNPNGTNIQMQNDVLQFQLPLALQPGFDCVASESLPEDLYAPIMPLLRYVGPSHFVRLLSALLCERRIILISKSITRLSMCVKAASSVLAQGLLSWKHVLIPVLPPHMIGLLSVKAPYLVGILKQFAPRLSRINGLTDVLCVNVDANELNTVNMATPRITVPDMLRKTPGKKTEQPAAEMLANDLDEIFQADQKLWQHNDKGDQRAKEVVVKDQEKVSDLGIDTPANDSFNKKRTILNRLAKTKDAGTNRAVMSLEERRQGSVDAAAAFGRMIRDIIGDNTEDVSTMMDTEPSAAAPKYSAPSQEVLGDMGCVEACTVAENHGGEEDIRAALTCFFLHMYGDMGMYLSETGGQFWLDRRKFLLRKKQLGEKEDSPTFLLLCKFCASQMFELHVKYRIDDMSMTSRDRSSIFPHHIPLFDICSKYLLMNKLEYSLMNIRRIVSATVVKCPRHIAVENSVEIRSRALALTSDTAFEGNVATALSDLVYLCRECKSNLSIVMSVIWQRLGQTKQQLWRHQLLALHLLKTVLLHGPVTAIVESLDGVEKIYDLRTFSNAKSAVSIKEVRQTADQVYDLLTDISRLFQRRRRIALSKVEQTLAMETKTWGNLLSRRLAFPIDSRNLHSLFCPDGHGMGADRNARENQKSLAALQRIDNNLRTSLRSSIRSSISDGLLGQLEQMKFEDEVDHSNKQTSQHLEGIREGGDSSHGANDDDLEAMSRAFSVNSWSVDEEDQAVATTFEQTIPELLRLDNSDYDRELAPQDFHDYEPELSVPLAPQSHPESQEQYYQQHYYEQGPASHAPAPYYDEQGSVSEQYCEQEPVSHAPPAYFDGQETVPEQQKDHNEDALSVPQSYYVEDGNGSKEDMQEYHDGKGDAVQEDIQKDSFNEEVDFGNNNEAAPLINNGGSGDGDAHSIT